MQWHSQIQAYPDINFFCPTISNITFFTWLIVSWINALPRPQWNLGRSIYVAEWILAHVTTNISRSREFMEWMAPHRRPLRTLCSHGTYNTMWSLIEERWPIHVYIIATLNSTICVIPLLCFSCFHCLLYPSHPPPYQFSWSNINALSIYQVSCAKANR